MSDTVERTHEVWFHFTKEPRYFSAVDEVREAHADPYEVSIRKKGLGGAHGKGLIEGQPRHSMVPEQAQHPLGRLPGSVWTLPDWEIHSLEEITHDIGDPTMQPTGSAQVVHGDARHLEFLADESVDLIVTSPPYFALRSYRDGDEHYDGQIGSEATPDDFIDALTACMDEWRRVLKPSGSVWVNLGDKYAGSGGHNNSNIGADSDRGPSSYNKETGTARPKSLMGLPWRFAIRQIDAGWILRAEVIWSKPNGLPESVTDRVRRSHEQWFHFTKEPRYFSAVDEVREAYQPATIARYKYAYSNYTSPTTRAGKMNAEGGARQGPLKSDIPAGHEANPLGRLPGSVWEIPTEPLIIPDAVREARNLPDHFAAFPQEWPRRIIQAWSPSGVCVECGEGRRPVVEAPGTGKDNNDRPVDRVRANGIGINGADWYKHRAENPRTITGYACACPTPDAPTRPAVVLDPFGGTGTVAGVARALGRHGISVDLSRDYCRLAEWRIFESGHFDKTLKRSMADKQGTLL